MSQINGNNKIEDETIHFSFNRFFTREGDKHFISVNRGTKFYIFYLNNDSGNWKLIRNKESIPEWLRQNEAQISNEINKSDWDGHLLAVFAAKETSLYIRRYGLHTRASACVARVKTTPESPYAFAKARPNWNTLYLD